MPEGLIIKIGADVQEAVRAIGRVTDNLEELADTGRGSLNSVTLGLQELRQAAAGAGNAKELGTFNRAIKQLGAEQTNLRKVGVELTNVGKSVGGIGSAATKAFSGLRTLAILIPGIGIGGIIGLLSTAIGGLVKSLLNSSRAFNEITDKMRLFNEVNKEANKQASSQITDLKILYGVATNVNLSMADRLAAVRALKAEFPDTFANINTEIILNGKAGASYDALAKSILATSRAKAAKDKLDIIEGQRLDILDKKQKIINATDREKAAITQDRITRVATGVKSELADNTKLVTQTVSFQRAFIDLRKKAALDEQDVFDKRLENQANFLVQFAGGETKIAKVIEDGIKGVNKTRLKVDLIENLGDKGAINIPVIIEQTDLQKAVNDAIETINARGLRESVLDINIDVPKIPVVITKEAEERAQNMADIVSGTLTPAFEGLFTSILQGQVSLSNFFQSLGNQITQLISKLAAAAAIAGILSLITGGESGALGGFSKIFQGFTGLKFAEGGVVFGPTLAMIGEGTGTSRSNPEVVAPLDRLKSLIGKTGTQRIGVDVRMRGRDLVGVNNREDRSQRRRF